MSVDFKSSETRENLMRAFAGESQARNRYTMAADIACQQKQEIVAALFRFTANQERAHAQVFYNHLKEFSGENIEITNAAYPVNVSQDLIELLNFAKHNEYEEANDVYTTFSAKAKEEGFAKVAYAFAEIARVEQTHCDRFEKMAEMLSESKLYQSSSSSTWICSFCGYIYEGEKVPDKCPVCTYDQGYFIPIELLSCKDFLAGKKA
ncbi:rubrerythrin family protein [Anaerosporobacter faecicola]|uniref:rubrerythrin family protein n=1 Tax=Anaerosporobacter faecicola TaxID=2718714 RepID=UPI00143BF6E0|nr:rubrerythrin family protein [Anaerosporobacter faecicola]